MKRKLRGVIESVNFKNKHYLKFLFLFSPILFSNPLHAMEIGVNAHLFKMNNKDLGIALSKLRTGGFEYVRIDIPWANVEYEKGKYEIYPRWEYIINELIKYHIKPIIVLGYVNPIYGSQKPTTKPLLDSYGQYVNYVAKHFNNKVYYYEPWNEWDSKLGGGSIGGINDYKNMLLVAYKKIKQNPNNFVIAGSFTSDSFDKFLTIGNKDENRFIINPNVSQYYDILSIHPYTTARPKPYDNYEYFVKQVEYINDLMKSEGLKKRVFITEMGWSTANSGYAVTEKNQDKYLINSICDSVKLNVSAYIIYDLVNDFATNGTDGNNAAAFGLYNHDWSNKISSYINGKINCKR